MTESGYHRLLQAIVKYVIRAYRAGEITADEMRAIRRYLFCE